MTEKVRDKLDRIFVAGHRGLVGSAIVRALGRLGISDLIVKTRAELDLRDKGAVRAFFETERPRQVYLAAAKVGGIHANNQYPADFIYDNLEVQNNIIHSAYVCGVEKLLFLGSSCIYPKRSPQPIREDYLMTGQLEPTNEPYALAKIAGISMCNAYNRQYDTDFRSVMPTNLYGPSDNYHPENSHVVPALIRRFHEAKVAGEAEVIIWGSGAPRREFLFVDDMASACVDIMALPVAAWRAAAPLGFVNVGCGDDISIAELAKLIADVVDFPGQVAYDASKPDGTPRKLLDIGLITAIGWAPQVDLRAGLQIAYDDFLARLT